ncbi:MAG: hypothetical protein M3Y45_04515 [Actinomycetota bacterium]|nr:hypothetical protein [Actinomycetota bacterium]
MDDARRFEGLEKCHIGKLEVPVAKGRTRVLGLARLDQDEAGPGLMIPRCNSVHTYGMRFPVHLVFLGPDRELMRVVLGFQPGGVMTTSGARIVVEVVPRGPDGLDGIGMVLQGASENLNPPEGGEVEFLIPDESQDISSWYRAA